jgi:phosphate transport system protein
MKRYFHTELEDLRSQLVLLGEKAIESVRMATRGLLEQDLYFSEKVLEMDDAIDDLEVEIDREAIRYISLRAPVASDLRLLTVSIKASHDLERVGDEATNIAKRTRRIQAEGPNPETLDIEAMTTIALEMLRDALDSFVEEDPEKAIAICRRDKQVDALDKSNFAGFTEQMKDAPENVSPLLEMAFISRSLERVADHATNIAEEVVFLLSGQEKKLTDLRG